MFQSPKNKLKSSSSSYSLIFNGLKLEGKIWSVPKKPKCAHILTNFIPQQSSIKPPLILFYYVYINCQFSETRIDWQDGEQKRRKKKQKELEKKKKDHWCLIEM